MAIIDELIQIMLADILLSADNALVIGMTASTIPEHIQGRAIAWGLAFSAGVRLFLAFISTLVIEVPGVMFAGGVLMLIFCWQYAGIFFQTVKRRRQTVLAIDTAGQNWGETDEPKVPHVGASLLTALVVVGLADILASFDNMVAVTSVARDDQILLLAGVSASVLTILFSARFIPRIVTYSRLLVWPSLAFLLYLAIDLISDGWRKLLVFMEFERYPWQWLHDAIAGYF